jgi:hypothetical protein
MVSFVLHSTEGNIKMDLKEIVGGEVDLVNLTQHTNKWQTLVHKVMNPCASENAWNFLTI